MKKFILVFLLGVIELSVWAKAPEMFRYQGRLVDGTNLVNSTLPMTFKLYDHPTVGTMLYEDYNTVSVVDGLYSTMIGDNTVSGSLTDALTNSMVYLEITIDGQTLSPREQLVSVPYAMDSGSGGNPVVSGSLVLSETYPNAELEEQGYSLYTSADWEETGDPSVAMGLISSPNFFGFGDRLGGYFAGNGYPILYLTEDGMPWVEYNIPLNMGMYPEIVELNDTLFFFGSNSYSSENVACSTSDFQNWNVWTNNFGDVASLNEVVSFKSALWAFGSQNSTNFVARSTDGANWTIMAENLSYYEGMSGDVLASDDTMWIVGPSDASGITNYVWSSTNGIDWSQSASAMPGIMSANLVVHHNDALWNFFADRECWKSLDHGDSWTVVTTNLPVTYDPVMHANNDPVISHDGKLWLRNRGNVYWSENGADWNRSLAFYTMDSGGFVGLPNGRLWITGDDGFYYIGGPKKDGGLYYYRKD